MSTAFEPMTPEQQGRFRATYLAYLRDRDGVPDLGTRRFDVRERFFAEVDAAPAPWTGAPLVDQGVFDRNHARNVPEPGLDAATLWALATAKTNRAERYGVEYAIAHQQAPADTEADPHTYIQIEEFYHTRILKDALATVGVSVEVLDPSFTTQLLVRAMVHLPEDFANVAILCGEIVGVTIFSLLLEKAREIFADQPGALARIELLFAQILVDEVGHVHFVRSGLSPAGLTLAKWLLPTVAHVTLLDIPELNLLFGRKEIVRRAVAADVDGAAAAYPDRLVFSSALIA